MTVIGLFGLAGLAGAAAAQRACRLNDRGLGLPIIGAAWALVLIALVIAGLWPNVRRRDRRRDHRP